MGYYVQTAISYLMVGLILLIPFYWARQQLIQRGILRRGSIAHEGAVLVFAVYMGGILALTLLPPRFTFPPEYSFRSTILEIWQGTFTAGPWIYTMFMGNVIMFIPFGLLVPILWRQRWWQTLLTALAATLCIELIQPFFARSFDIDDIVLNFAGGAIGLLLSAIPRALCPGLVHKVRE